MSELIRVGMSEIAWAKSPDLLITLGLGSCVGVCIYDPFLRIGGMAHIMLPDSSLAREVTNRGKFADTAIPDLVQKLIDLGSLKTRMIVKIAGGAQMFGNIQDDKLLIGPRNVTAVEEALSGLGLKISGKSVGGHLGRSLRFDLASGTVTVKILNQEEIVL